MKVYMSMLYYQLQKTHKLSYNHKTFLDKAPMKFPMYFTGCAPSPDYIYLTDSKNWNHMDSHMDNISILCLGKPSFLPKNARYEIITVEENDPCYDIHDLHNEVSRIFQMYYEWENSLTELVYGSQDMPEILRISEKILENPCILIDADFFYMAYSTNFFTAQNIAILDDDDPSSMPLNYVNEFRLDPEFKKFTRKKGVFLYDEDDELGKILCHNITYRNRYFARLLMPESHHPLNEADRKHLAFLAHHLQTLFDIRMGSLVLSNRSENVHQLLKALAIENKPISELDTDRILNGSEWARNDRYLVIYLKLLVSSGVTANTAYLCSKIEKLWKGSCTFPYEEGILWILNLNLYQNSHDYSFYDTFAYFLRESLCQAGISNDYTGIHRTALFVQQAKTALKIGGQKKPTHWYHYFKDYTLDYMLSQCTLQFPAEEICHPAILKLRQHDAENHTEYYTTLKSYLEHKFAVTDTAKALFIHRTTLIHRLKKIQELCSLDLNNPQTIQHLMISFSLLQ